MTEPNTTVPKEPSEVTPPEPIRGGTYYTPLVDIYETADEIVLQCDMPGVKPQDLDVRFEKGELSLSGKVQPRQVPAEYAAEEYGVGDFYRSFTIAREIDPEKISAEYREGVLTVHLPRPAKLKPKRIAITAS